MANQSIVMEGAVHALQNSGALLKNAVGLYSAREYSAAVALALLGREELGKYLLLREEFDKAQAGGVELNGIKKLLSQHYEKQMQSMLSISWQSSDEPVAQAFDVIARNAPGSSGHLEAMGIIESEVDRARKSLPKQRHALRMRALYVDWSDEYSRWIKPIEIGFREAREEVCRAVEDYCVSRRRLVEPVLDPPGDFVDAYRAWVEKPGIVDLKWPD